MTYSLECRRPVATQDRSMRAKYTKDAKHLRELARVRQTFTAERSGKRVWPHTLYVSCRVLQLGCSQGLCERGQQLCLKTNGVGGRR